MSDPTNAPKPEESGLTEPIRSDVVEMLVKAANIGMAHAIEEFNLLHPGEQATGMEYWSACMTLALHTVITCGERGGDKQAMRNSVNMLLLYCADDARAN